ncbi:hypothetical protein BO82DRAFT_405464 [Aspergillus uvarum CBS 121591]|uniref:Uncharacterized protein n=1 Tax=Aspergillus uvarum CBS 121591 TaxID=1448315 RepID=A0A319C281_9EURO|nr:hypothetical protein BO82DRAFT_405464 [Aspergillus uvarum CBS 121591]PYH78277.1 hypothetical protein BO82DRAFT_405464 [Aspergillus uvarum CBS 121591]
MSLFTKTIHITAHPAPRTLSDSKLILTALQKFGEVVTFRNLRYDVTNLPTTTKTTRPPSHNIIAIYESAAAATAACAASPLSIPLTPDAQAQAQHTPQSQSQSQSELQSQSQSQLQSQSPAQFTQAQPPKQKQYYTPLPLPPQQQQQQHASPDAAAPHNLPALDPTRSDEDHPTTISCTLTASRTNHAAAIRRNPWYAGFEVERTSHPRMFADLVHAGIPLRELADGPAGRRKAAGVPHGRRQRVEAETVRWGAGSLMGLFRGDLRGNNGGDVGGRRKGGEEKSRE